MIRSVRTLAKKGVTTPTILPTDHVHAMVLVCILLISNNTTTLIFSLSFTNPRVPFSAPSQPCFRLSPFYIFLTQQPKAKAKALQDTVQTARLHEKRLRHFSLHVSWPRCKSGKLFDHYHTIMKLLSILATTAAIFGANAQQGVGGDGPCTPCPDGITASGDTQTIPGKTCGNLQQDAASYAASSQTCISITSSAEGICCPATTTTTTEAASTTCSVCSGGITAPANTQITGGGKTCGDLLIDALNVDDQSSICDAMKTSEIVCCPAVATTTAATTTVETTTKSATTESATTVANSDVTGTPTAKKTTSGPTTRDQLFGNVPTPTIAPGEEEKPLTSPQPTLKPNPKPSLPTDTPAYFPTYSPSTDDFNNLAGNGKAPPDYSGGGGSSYNLAGNPSASTSAGNSASFRFDFAVIFVLDCLVLFLFK